MPTRSRPTSNCGLTSARQSNAGAAAASTAGSTFASEMNDTSADDQVRPVGQLAGIERAGVAALDHRDPRVLADAPVELAVGHVERGHGVAELKAGYMSDRLSVSAKYAFIQAQPLYSFETDRQELSLGASTRIHENWRIFGSGTYDLEKNLLLKDAIGLAYDDECFTYIMTLSESRDRDSRETTTHHRLQSLLPHAWRPRGGQGRPDNRAVKPRRRSSGEPPGACGDMVSPHSRTMYRHHIRTRRPRRDQTSCFR